jgi:selenocysteine lyase/cysteine desulfurase
MPLDIDFIRSQFPAFREPSLAGWSFFENAGGSYMCQQVIDRLLTFYTQTKVQPYYPYPASTEAGKRMDESYTRLSAYLNIGEDELNFGPSTSQNVYVLATALRPMWGDGSPSFRTKDQSAPTTSGLFIVAGGLPLATILFKYSGIFRFSGRSIWHTDGPVGYNDFRLSELVYS